MPQKKVDIKVPKEAGEAIVLSRGGQDPVTYNVTDGKVSVPEAEAAHFLAIVEGSTAVGGTTATDKKE